MENLVFITEHACIVVYQSVEFGVVYLATSQHQSAGVAEHISRAGMTQVSTRTMERLGHTALWMMSCHVNVVAFSSNIVCLCQGLDPKHLHIIHAYTPAPSEHVQDPWESDGMIPLQFPCDARLELRLSSLHKSKHKKHQLCWRFHLPGQEHCTSHVTSSCADSLVSTLGGVAL